MEFREAPPFSLSDLRVLLFKFFPVGSMKDPLMKALSSQRPPLSETRHRHPRILDSDQMDDHEPAWRLSGVFSPDGGDRPLAFLLDQAGKISPKVLLFQSLGSEFRG